MVKGVVMAIPVDSTCWTSRRGLAGGAGRGRGETSHDKSD